MDKRGWMMFKVFINRYNPKAGETLLKFLPEEDRRVALSQDILSSDLAPLLYQPHKLFERMHYSWIQPLLEQFPERLHPLVTAALTAEQVSGLTASPPLVSVADPVRTFIINQLYTLLKADEHLPLEYLPEAEFSPLAKWDKNKLILLIDLLGLHDLASEVRHIVNKNHLKNIYSCLSSKQLYYLNVCLHQKETIIAPKLGIDPSKKDCKTLKRIVHRRGLLRLGKALCGQHPDLVWYIAHVLDIGRGKMLLKTYQSDSSPKVTPFLKTQVINLMNFLKSE
ncbi:hypothetical protein [Candidatus Protochlamydia phocaeensis]|uniref:hypothetical protein n=1 Tax=Candidatus Protochlamydia phocaeensis TaxID=1414722 RepID=UPI000838B3F5|nr:hypothetical protein [Candidatus Protochlamydia phocaeensis]